MPRYSQALTEVLDNLSAPVRAVAAVEVIVHQGGVAGPTQRFYNVPEHIINEAIAHMNDNSVIT